MRRFFIQKNLLSLCISLCLSAYFIYWLRHNVTRSDLISNLHSLPVLPYLTMSILYLFISLCYAWRYRLLTNFSFYNSYSIISVGITMNSILPFRIGDVIKIYYATKNFQASTLLVITSTIIEHGLDFIFLLFLLLIIFIFYGNTFGLNLFNKNLFFLAICFLSITLFATCLISRVIRNFLKSFFSKRIVREIFLNQRFILNKLTIFKILLSSIFIWCLTVLNIYLFLHLSIFENKVTIGISLAILVCTTFSSAVPSIIANAGVFEAIVVFFLKNQLHLDTSYALTLAIALHLFSLLPQIFVMFLVLLYQNLSKLRSYFFSKQQLDIT